MNTATIYLADRNGHVLAQSSSHNGEVHFFISNGVGGKTYYKKTDRTHKGCPVYQEGDYKP